MCHVTHGGIQHVIQCSAPSAASKESQWRWAVCVLITPLCLEPSLPETISVFNDDLQTTCCRCYYIPMSPILWIWRGGCFPQWPRSNLMVYKSPPMAQQYNCLWIHHTAATFVIRIEWFSWDKPQTAVLIMVVLDVRLLLYSHLFGHNCTSNCTLLFLVSYVRLQLKRSIWRYAFTTWTVCTCVKDD